MLQLYPVVRLQDSSDFPAISPSELSHALCMMQSNIHRATVWSCHLISEVWFTQATKSSEIKAGGVPATCWEAAVTPLLTNLGKGVLLVCLFKPH